MTEPVRPLEALIAEKIAEWREVGLRMCPKVQQPNGGWSRQEYVDRPVGALYLMHADELAALLQAAAPPAPTAEQDGLEDWVPKFTVWLVRRGSHLPMVVDSVFIQEELARKRVAVLRSGLARDSYEWHAEKYQHLTAAPPERVSEGKECAWVSVVEDETGDYSTSCGKEFQSLDGEPPTFIKFCCYCGKSVRLIDETAACPAVEPREEPTHE